MLWRKLLMTGVSAPALSSHWILPGGRIMTVIDGHLRTVAPAAGWPQWSEAGDPFRDSEGRFGTYEQENLGGGVGQVLSIRLRDKGSDREAPRSLGPYRGWASESVAIGMSSTGIGASGNPFGYSRPSWQMDGNAGGTDTGYTADWPWEQQSNGTIAGESTLPKHVQVIQASYTPNMAYPSGVCVARDLGVVLRLAATAMTGEQSTDPNGRPWIGWTIDAAGTVRRIADLSPAYARQLGRDNGFVPPDDAIIEASGQGYGWEFLRPIGPVGNDAVLATGCLRYEESYTRHPTADELPYYTLGRPGYSTTHVSAPLLDAPMRWYYPASTPPVTITERRAVNVFATVLIRAGGIAQVSVTGTSLSGSAWVKASNKDFYVFKHRDGSYDVLWEGHPARAQYRYLGETFASRFVTSPNGWRTPILIPVYSPSGRTVGYDFRTGMYADEVPADGYMPVWFAPDDPRLGSTPPAKPADWSEEEQGPWVQPPFDVDDRYAWRGMRYWYPTEREWHWQRDQNSTYADYGRYGHASTSHPLYPAGPYAKSGAGQWYGRGEFVVARHHDGTMSSHAASTIVPGIATGPGGMLHPHAEPDGRTPVMRLLRWPGRSHVLRMLQDGSWAYSSNGRAWTPIASLGAMQGTLSVAATLSEPNDE